MSDDSHKVFLPKTGFPMRANLPERELEILAHWQNIDLRQKLRDQAEAQNRERFILHDGPPYANGNLHIGHAVNKILKDVINRTEQARGKYADYLPGWDCHGLPIEWKVEEDFRAGQKDKKQIPINDFRAECRKFAAKWVETQKKEFQRLGVIGDWDSPYLTMDFAAEAIIAENIGKFLLDGSLYRGKRPVMWSVVERTALAEAEVEYREHKSPSLWVRFPVAAGDADLLDAGIVIWTTTPWTLPGNRAIAYHRDLNYLLVTVTDEASECCGARLILAASLLESFKQAAKITEVEIISDRLDTRGFESLQCAHPLYGQGYDFTVPVRHGDFVTQAQGTGFVHIGPANGIDDYQFALTHDLEVPDLIDDDSSFRADVSVFAGKRILCDDGTDGDANGAVIGALKTAGHLLAKQSYRHDYPHSWRSKAPVIYRNTAQWFISMSERNLRQKALDALESVRFYPASGKARLSGMIENRPDWCISRQRAWGVPLPIFTHRDTGEILRDPEVIARIIDAFKQEGADCWFASPKSRFLGENYHADDYEQVQDVVDVWFDSGSTHSFVLQRRGDYPADLYLEGSDQHRGWFHSSLLVAAGLCDSAPYKAVLTHGFALDKDGKKMSKSLGNVIAPQDVIDQYGADILRLWVINTDYSDDIRIGDEILKRQVDVYRRIRNTLRFLLGNLNDTDRPDEIPYAQLPELEQYVLANIYRWDQDMSQDSEQYHFTRYSHRLYYLCHWLSYGYFDIRKDCLYCDSKTDSKRRAALYVLSLLFDFVVTRISPIVCFTAEEAWRHRYGEDSSVVPAGFSDVGDEWDNPALLEKWSKVFQWRDFVNTLIETARREQGLKSSLEIAVTLGLPKVDCGLAESIGNEVLTEIMILGAFDVKFDETTQTIAEVSTGKANGEKCVRCWRVLPEVQTDKDKLCDRCRKVIGESR